MLEASHTVHRLACSEDPRSDRMPFRPKAKGPNDPYASTEKLMQTFRIPRELVKFLKDDAAKNGLDLTAYVNKMLDGVRTWYGMPVAVSQLLDEDRENMKLRRYDYIQHLMFQRSMEVREKGVGFDAPGGGGEKKKR
jgi:hypothetical protein